MAKPLRSSTHLVTTQTPSGSQSLQTVMSFVPCVQLSPAVKRSALAASCIATLVTNSINAADRLDSETWVFMVLSSFVGIGMSANLPVGRVEDEFGSKLDLSTNLRVKQTVQKFNMVTEPAAMIAGAVREMHLRRHSRPSP